VGRRGKEKHVAGNEWDVSSEPQLLVFHGARELTIDDKNRLLIPSDVRRKIDPQRDGDAFYLVEGIDGRLWLYPELYYDSLVAQQQNELMPDADDLAYDRWNLGSAERIEWDKQGRILIPDGFLKEAGIGKEVTLVGVRDHLELWNRSDWNAERESLRKRKAEIAVKRKTRLPPTSQQM
jgi:MraZ protein